MFLSHRSGKVSKIRFLHVRGGVSASSSYCAYLSSFSPRAWRCFYRNSTKKRQTRVFSTCVEVFLYRGLDRLLSICFLHVRGGVSAGFQGIRGKKKFSPRAWRCFRIDKARGLATRVFSTCVEVFLRVYEIERERHRFLHVRGGVSYAFGQKKLIGEFSPRAWRCFYTVLENRESNQVFSTCVEVFLRATYYGRHIPSFLHVRGGVSSGALGTETLQ